MRLPLIFVLAAGTLAAGCTTDVGGGGSDAGGAAGATANATLTDASGAAKGSATFRQVSDGVQVSVNATGMPPGPKGLHLHMTGRCDPPGFESAGGHWNPTAMKHGKEAPNGPHRGDLDNIDIAADGSGRAEAVIRGAMLTGGDTPLLDADGAALIIHAGPDDYRTDPSGNSGGRVACGVVTAG